VLESYRELLVWQRAIETALAVYELTSSFPKGERFGLTNQLRRASVSVPSNIAEGYGRNTKGEYKQFLGIARGSNLEVQTQLTLAIRLHFGVPEDYKIAESLSVEVERMLNSLIAKL
jgi:four helix bundle protein